MKTLSMALETLRRKKQKQCMSWKVGRRTTKYYLQSITAIEKMISQQLWLCHWVYTRLPLPIINHRSETNPWSPIPFCWIIDYWWILGEGQSLSSVVYLLLSLPGFETMDSSKLVATQTVQIKISRWQNKAKKYKCGKEQIWLIRKIRSRAMRSTK